MRGLRFSIVLMLLAGWSTCSLLAQDIKHESKLLLNPVVTADNIAAAQSTAPPAAIYMAKSHLWDQLQNIPGNSIGHKKAKELRAYVKLNIDHEYTKMYPKYVYQVYYTLRGYKTPGDDNTFDNLNTEMLTISYDPEGLNAYQDIHMKTYYDYYKVEMEVLDIVDVTCLYDPINPCALPVNGQGFLLNSANAPLNTMARNWSIELGLYTQEFIKDVKIASTWESRYGSTAVPTSINYTAPAAGDNHLTVNWNINGGVAETPVMYELEWTYIDDYRVEFGTSSLEPNKPISTKSTNPVDVHYNFEESATRIITDKESYKIPLIYKRGYLIYRVRYVRPDETKYEHYLKGPWTLPAAGNIAGITNATNDVHYYYIAQNQKHTDDKLNWNYQNSFAEEGKSKGVVTYFDGLLKNRQSVTKFSSQLDQSIVAESYYNFNGQAALQTLPIPTPSVALNYIPNFAQHGSYTNTNMTPQQAYPAGSYDAVDIDNKKPYPLPALSTSLANQYYSPTNFILGSPTASEHIKTIPDAEGYPLIHSTFDPIDGRIRKQGGAGSTMQLFKPANQKRVTRTYYTPPKSDELDKYLGLNIGEAAYYEKVITQDPNDQLSYSILDNRGKVRISGLMGFDNANSPLVLPDHVTIPAATPGSFKKVNLIKGLTTTSWIAGRREIGTTFFQETACKPELSHTIGLTDFTPCTGYYLNVPMQFELEFMDEDGSVLHPNNTGPITFGAFHQGTSASLGSNYSLINTDLDNQVPIGLTAMNYTLSYKKEDVKKAVHDLVFPANQANYPASPCFKQYDDFLNDALDNIEPCDEMALNGDEINECDVFDDMIKADIAPGGIYGGYGQNATYGFVGTPVSIFAVCGYKEVDAPINLSYSNPLNYADAAVVNSNPVADPFDLSMLATNPNPSTHIYPIYRYQYYLNSFSMTTPVGSNQDAPTVEDVLKWSPNDLISRWNDDIASFFMPLHPEYCHRQNSVCDMTTYQQKLESISTYQQAVNLNLNTLDLLSGTDPLLVNLSNASLSMNSSSPYYWTSNPENYLKHMPIKEGANSNYVARRLDHIAYKTQFCGNDVAYANAVNAKLESVIEGEIASANTNAQDAYIQNLINLYIANRNTVKARFNRNVSTCSVNNAYAPSFHNYPHPNTGEDHIKEKFPKVYDHFNDVLPNSDWINLANNGDPITAGLNNVTNTGFNTTGFNSAVNGGASAANLYDEYANEICKRLANCMAGSTAFNATAFKASLLNKMNTSSQGAEWVGGIGPNELKDLLTQTHSYNLDDLCNPYLVDYLRHPAAAFNQQVQCLDEPGIKNFFNSYGLKGDISNYVANFNSSSQSAVTTLASNITLLATNLFEKELIKTLAGQYQSNLGGVKISGHMSNNIIAIFIHKANVVPTNLNSVRLELDLSGRSASDAAGINYFANTIFGNVVCQNSGKYNFDLHFGAAGESGPVIVPLIIKGISTEENTPSCLSCKELKDAWESIDAQHGFEDGVMKTYGIKGSNHPMWNRAMKSYFNYRFNKKHSAARYLAFMEGCNLTQYHNIPVYKSYLTITNKIPFNLAIPAANLTTTAVTTNQVVNFIKNNTTVGLEYFKDIKFTHFVKWNPTASAYTDAELMIDLNTIPKDKIREFVNVLQSQYVNFATLFNLQQNEIEFDPSSNDPNKKKRVAEFYVHNLDNQSNYSYYPSPLPANHPAPSSMQNWMPEYNAINTTQYASTATSLSHTTTEGALIDGINVFKVKKYTIDHNTVPTNAADVSAALYKIQDIMVPQVHKTFSYYPAVLSHLNEDNIRNIKKDYLTYSYSLNTKPGPETMEALQPDKLIANINGQGVYNTNYYQFTNNSAWPNGVHAYLSYHNVDLGGPGEDLFLKKNLHNDIGRHFIVDVRNKLNSLSGSSFPATVPNSATVSGWSLSTQKISNNGDNIYWIRLRKNLQLRNIYLRMPASIDPNDYDNYLMDLIFLAPTTDIVRTITARITKIGSSNETYMIDGKTDFDLTNAPVTVFENVMLCDNVEPNPITTCVEEAIAQAPIRAQNQFDAYRASLERRLINQFEQHIETTLDDKLEVRNPQFKYITTLYGYDRAGNLAYTVPPEGVRKISDANLPLVQDYRNDALIPAQIGAITPNHKKKTSYYYDSQNRLISQNTPDGGNTEFFYDKAGRLIFSQNAKQKVVHNYSYTLYDKQSRIIETGEVRGVLIMAYINCLKDHSYTYQYKDIRQAVLGQTRWQVTHTFYDEEIKDLSAIAGFAQQTNLRSRVATIASHASIPAGAEASASNFSIATHYSYDISGNVKTLVYDMPRLEDFLQRYKRIDYDYDLYSGKVTLVSYNRSFADQYYQRYKYDADNRITDVETSKDGLLWDEDARYSYYPHGPLARVGLGDLRSQGVDFVYTLQGWLKSINGDGAIAADPSQDGSNSAYNKDLAKTTLHYYEGDYTPIDQTNYELSLPNVNQSVSLYNGNIAAMTSIPGNFPTLRSNYTYDQLNRIKETNYQMADYDPQLAMANRIKNFSSLNANGAWNPNVSANNITAQTDDLYKTQFTYDKDGNIEHLIRYGLRAVDKTDYITTPAETYLMDDITYTYNDDINNTLDPINQLEGYFDAANRNTGSGPNPPTKTDEITGVYDGFNNDIEYDGSATAVHTKSLSYDKIGNLVDDNKNNLHDMVWSVYGKLKSVSMAGNKMMNFGYDPSNNRWSKSMVDYPNMKRRNQYYIRDASGNILAIYKHIQDLVHVSPMADITNGLSPVSHFPGDLHAAMSQVSGYQSMLVDQIIELNPTFASAYTANKDVSYYVNNNTGIRNNMIRTSAHVISGINNYNQSCLTNMYNTGAINNALLEPMVYNSNSEDQTSFLNAVIDESDLGTMYNILVALGDERAPENRADFTSRFISYTQEMPELCTEALARNVQYDDYYSGLPSLFNNEAYLASRHPRMRHESMEANLKEDLVLLGNVGIIANYFNQAEDGSSVLEKASSTSLKLTTICNVEGAQLHSDVMAQTNGKDIIAATLDMNDDITPMKLLKGLGSVSATPDIYLHYDMGTVSSNDEFFLAEHHLYGSSRLGTKEYWQSEYNLKYVPNGDVDINQAHLANSAFNYRRPWFSKLYNAMIGYQYTSPFGHEHTNALYSSRLLGQKKYEITNHLGNVLTVISDKEEDIPANPFPANNTAFVEEVRSDVQSGLYAAYDYYPFGMLMPDRFVQHQKEQCVWVSQNQYIKAPIDQWTLSLFNENDLSQFTPMAGSMIKYVTTSSSDALGYVMISGPEYEIPANVDINLGSTVANMPVEVTLDVATIGNNPLLVHIVQYNSSTQEDEVLATYEMPANRESSFKMEGVSLNNEPLRALLRSSGEGENSYKINQVRFAVKDVQVVPKLVSICNTDNFDTDYRFGFNGQEKDNEVAGIGNSNTAMFWQYDSRLGRRWNIDPVVKHSLSGYSTFSGNPILFRDIHGDDTTSGEFNVFIAPKKRDKNLEMSYQQALSASKKSKGNLIVIEASGATDAYNQIQAIRDRHKSEVDEEYCSSVETMIFDSHGNYKSAFFKVGSSTTVRNGTGGNLAKLGTLMSSDGQVVLLACHAGGNGKNDGNRLITNLSNTMQKRVWGSNSWTGGFNMFGNGQNLSQPNGDHMTDGKQPLAWKNLGSWTSAYGRNISRYPSGISFTAHGNVSINNVSVVAPASRVFQKFRKWLKDF